MSKAEDDNMYKSFLARTRAQQMLAKARMPSRMEAAQKARHKLQLSFSRTTSRTHHVLMVLYDFGISVLVIPKSHSIALPQSMFIKTPSPVL